MNSVTSVLTVAAALGSGIVAGVFFAFSSFVMRGLAKIPPSQGIAAMQSINIVVINPVFMLAFMGTALLCLGLGVWSIIGWEREGAGYLLAGCLMYLLGTIGTTMLFNVPRNEVLARMEPNSAETATYWARYVSEWTFANHIRTLASAVAMVLMVIALMKFARLTANQ